MDWQALLYGPTYATLGVPAVLTLPGTDGAVIDKGADGGPLLVIDKTSGIVTSGGGQNRFSAEVQTIAPAAAVRAPDLAAVDRASLADATLAMNGKTWTVETHAFRPSPNGEGDGEILLILTEA